MTDVEIIQEMTPRWNPVSPKFTSKDIKEIHRIAKSLGIKSCGCKNRVGDDFLLIRNKMGLSVRKPILYDEWKYNGVGGRWVYKGVTYYLNEQTPEDIIRLYVLKNPTQCIYIPIH